MKLSSLLLISFILITNTYFQLTQKPDNKFHVTFCDVGQGDGIVLRSPENTIYLIDAGPDASILSCLGDKTPIFNRSINTIFISHLHADHLAGAIEVVKRYGVKTISTNTIGYQTPETQELVKQVKDHNVRLIETRKGQQLQLGSAISMQVYWPELTSWNQENGNWQAYLDDFNDSSLVFTLQHNKVLFIFTGDAGGKILDMIAQTQQYQDALRNTKVHILKVSHHGSKDVLAQRFLEATMPNLAVISAGKDNDFGHPHPEVLSELNKRNIPIARTDLNGDIEVTSNGMKVDTKYNNKK